MIDELQHSSRVLLEADLAPVQGDRFQPTGFADIGAATYQLADGTRMLLVESAQSVANRLEATIIGPDGELVPELAGLSYVRARLSGASDEVVTSLTEAHRLNSPFLIADADLQRQFLHEAGYQKGKRIDWQRVARAVFRYDVNSLLHGLFLANVEDGRIRLQRAVSGFIEARDVREAVSGGVKNNPIDPTGTIRSKAITKDVYSNVPFQRVEFTAGAITAYFNLDLGLLRSYGLEPAAVDLLVALGLLKIRRFVDGGLRLRTACDLAVRGAPRANAPKGFEIPSEDELLALLRDHIGQCQPLFAEPAVTEVATAVVQTKKSS